MHHHLHSQPLIYRPGFRLRFQLFESLTLYYYTTSITTARRFEIFNISQKKKKSLNFRTGNIYKWKHSAAICKARAEKQERKSSTQHFKPGSGSVCQGPFLHKWAHKPPVPVQILVLSFSLSLAILSVEAHDNGRSSNVWSSEFSLIWVVKVRPLKPVYFSEKKGGFSLLSPSLFFTFFPLL